MKFPIPIGVAAVAAGLPLFASAETDTPHAGTEPALQCLLHSGMRGCEMVFAAAASPQAVRWVRRSPWPDFALGAVQSAKYAHTISGTNAYDTRFLNGRMADVYDVKFTHEEMTFYIAVPEPDGKIRQLLIRTGSPDDERRDLFVHGPG